MDICGEWTEMTHNFYADVKARVEPLLQTMGFVLDEVDDNPDEGGIARNIVYYRSSDCKLQIYYSSREGEINCMIAPLDASNEFGLNGDKWYFISYFSKRPDLSPQERLRQALAEVEAYDNRLDWVRDRIVKHYEAAHAAILKKYSTG
jgi:hypothetical protein